MKIVKMRVGKVLDLTTNELLYNVEFKFENQHRHFIQWEPIRMVKFLCPIVKNHKSNHEQTNSKCSNRND